MKLTLPDSLTKKLMLILMTVAMLSVALVASIFTLYEIQRQEHEQQQNLETMADILAPNITAAVMFGDVEAVKELISPMLLQKEVIVVLVVNKQKQLLTHVKRDSSSPFRLNHQVHKVHTPLLLGEEKYGELFIVADDSVLAQSIKIYSLFLLGLLLLVIFISYFVSRWLTEPFLTPILNLVEMVKRVTQTNNYALRAKVHHKDEVGELTQCVNTMLTTIEMRDKLLESQVQKRTLELEKANQQLQTLAYNDPLTDLPNRRNFYETLQALVVNDKQKFALMFIDLDGFKEVNDTYGHHFGDELLKNVSLRLSRCIRSIDIVARLGGDEFTIILQAVTQSERVKQIADAIIGSIAEPFNIYDKQINITTSLGVTFFPSDALGVEDLLKFADQAMYLAKTLGRNNCQFFSYDMQAKLNQRKKLIADIGQAIEKQQLDIFYQPIVSMEVAPIFKVEALLRWHHPEYGLLTPEKFIPFAEEHQLISDIGHWMRQRVLNDLIKMTKAIGREFEAGVNTSTLEVDEQGLWVQAWVTEIAHAGLPFHCINIELTETTLMKANSHIQPHLKELQQQGMQLSIDDFGVGFSSLSYLQQLQANYLKIDKSFIHNISDNKNQFILVKTMIEMAHQLNIQVVAEGVEHADQYHILKDLECDFIQGFLFSEPLNCDTFIEFIQQDDAHCLALHATQRSKGRV